MSGVEIFQAQHVPHVIGPYHTSLPGPMRAHLRMDGNVVVDSQIETGFIHRGLEKSIELHPWESAGSYVGRVDPEAPIFYELAFCMAAEAIHGVEAPPRATRIRTLVCELGRVASHLGFLARFARACQAETLFHFVTRDRERVLDLFELLTGSRFAYGFARIGGVSADVTDGFIERVVETCELMNFRVREYNDLFSYNHAFLRRSRGLGELPLSLAQAAMVTGPNLRASGGSKDLRFEAGLLDYAQLDLEAPIRHEDEVQGDVFSRYLVRVREIQQSIEVLKRALEAFPEGAHRSTRLTRDSKLRPGEASVRLEGPRGRMGCRLISDGGTHPARAHFLVPSQSILGVLPAMLSGVLIEDLALVLASVDLSISEVDR